MLGLLIASSLFFLCRAENDGYEPSYYDEQQYGYDDQCNCNEICGGQEPEEWEYEYEEVPPCIINNCGVELNKCASADSCVAGIEGVVSQCYENNENPMQCMDELAQDTESNQFTQFCDDNEECGTDLKSLGSCVINSANYGFCEDEVYKKLKLKSVAKTIKIRSRKQKRKAAALKSKSKRARYKKARKVRGKRASKLRKARESKRELLSENEYSSDYENPEYDYGCYCDCGEQEEEIPPCITDNCGEQLFACGESEDCVNGVEGVIATCYEDNDTPQQCMDELIKESDGQSAIELCDGNEEAAGDLQALGDCVINSANYGFCTEDEYKKLKLKALVKATKKVRARRVASKQRKARSQRRARSAKAQRQRKARAQRSRSRVRPRSRADAQRLAKSKRARARSQRSRKQKQRSNRRKLQSTEGCCECTDASDEPYCNEECDNTICSYDPYCCNEDYGSWDWICAAAAESECNGDAGGDEYEFDYYEPPQASAACCECTEDSDSPFCNEECDANICSYDPYCCNNSWDWICANSAKDECLASGNTFPGYVPPGDPESCCDCTETENGQGCSTNPECDTIVCPLDEFCCNNYWDSICANGAGNVCNAVDYWSWESSTNYDYSDYGATDSWYQDSYDFNYGYSNYESYDDSANYDYGSYSYYSPSGDFTYSDEPYYNSEEYSDSTYEPTEEPTYEPYDNYQPSYETYDSFNNYQYSNYNNYDPNSYDYSYNNYDSYYQPSNDYSDNYGYDSYSYYSPSGEFTYSDEPYYNSEEYSYYNYDQYDYDTCNCNEVCYGQESEEWEFDYADIPQCVKADCGEQLDTCAYDDTCVTGLEALVNSCQSEGCLEEIIKDTETNQFSAFCAGDETCAADLQSLGQCVLDIETSGSCDDEYKKLKLKSVLKTVKQRSRKQKRKSAAARQKLKRRSRKSRKSRKSRRKLQEGLDNNYYDSYEYEQGSDYENPEYDYGCYCDCDEEEEIPSCIVDNCGQQLATCGESEACVNGIEGVKDKCYEDNENPEQCMDELVQDQEAGKLFKEVCDFDDTCATDLKELVKCVINSANYGMCPEDEYKKLKIKSLVKATKKVRARKMASKHRKARVSKRRARSAKAQRQSRSRSRAEAQRLAKSKRARARSQRSKKQKQRSNRRKLQSTEGCCECTDASDEPYCNEECDNTICSYDPYCCNEDYGSWDWICADSAVSECDGDDSYQGSYDFNYGYSNYETYEPTAEPTYEPTEEPTFEDEYKKLKIKSSVKATKKVRARKMASKQRKARVSNRARSSRSQRRVRKQRSRASAVAGKQRQRRARAQRTRAQRSRRLRKLRRRKRQMMRQRN